MNQVNGGDERDVDGDGDDNDVDGDDDGGLF